MNHIIASRHELLTPDQSRAHQTLSKTCAYLVDTLANGDRRGYNPGLVLAGGMNKIYLCIGACEAAGMDAYVIKEAMHPLIELLSSDFVIRMRTWPKGYQEDFETTDTLYFRKNREVPQSVKWLANEYIHALPIAQQHRNKIEHQSRMIEEAVRKNNEANIAVLACGGGIDLCMIEETLHNSNATIFINDQDPDAIDATRARCHSLSSRLQPLTMNVVHAVRKLKWEKGFDLIVAGGVFDYLNDSIVHHLIRNCREILKPDGRLLFTNLANDHPFRIGMEYVLNWYLNARSEQDIVRLCAQAGVTADCVKLSREATGLAMMVEVRKCD